MGFSDDVHLGLCLGVILAVKFFMLNPRVNEHQQLIWVPYFLSFAVGVPLIGYGKPLSHYVNVFFAGFFSYYSLMQSEIIWDYIYNTLRHHCHTIYDLIVFRGSLGNMVLDMLPGSVRAFLSDKLKTPAMPAAQQGFGYRPPGLGGPGGPGGFQGTQPFQRQGQMSQMSSFTPTPTMPGGAPPAEG